MLATILIYLVYGVVFVLLSPLLLLPNVSLPAGFLNSVSQSGNALGFINVIVPTETILYAIVAYLVVEGAIHAFKWLIFAIKKIPGIG